jgi:hypothetical protein
VVAERVCVITLLSSEENSQRAGLLRPDYSEKSQGRRAQDSDGKVTAAVKVDVSAASGLQVKNLLKHPKGFLPLEVFSDSAAGALPAIWAKLPQSWILQGKGKGWKKITKKCKLFLNGNEQKKRVNAGVKKEKIIVIDHLVTSISSQFLQCLTTLYLAIQL